MPEFAASTIGWVAIAAVASLCTALLYPAQRLLMRDAGPTQRATSILIYALLGPATATLVIVLLNNPLLISALLPVHCHGDMCAPHAPELAASAGVGAALISVVTIACALLAGVLYYGLQRQLQRVRALDVLSAAPTEQDYRIIESAAPLAWCSGLWRPQIYVSRGLLELLQPQQLAVVLAHEQAHVLRRDNLRKLLLHWATLFWPGRIRSQAQADYSAACEQLCDAIAARRVRDPALVMDTIGLFGTGAATQQKRLQTAFAAQFVEARMTALREAPVTSWLAVYGWCLIAIVWVAQVGLLTRLAHPLIESLAG